MSALPRQRPLAAAAALVVAVLVAYGPVWSAGFLWDDDALITANDAVREPGGLADAWTGRGQDDYLPLTLGLYWLEWRLWGDDPTGYHAVNLALHALASLLVWRLLARLRVPGAWLAALVFAVHPVGVASVAWISEGKNTLSLVLAACACLAWLRGEQARTDGAPGGARWLALSTVTFAAALLAKTAVAPVPLVLLACAWWCRGRIARADVLWVLPHLALALALGALTVRFQHAQDLGSLVVRPEGLLSRLAVAGRALWFYAARLAWPVGLSPVYTRWDVAGTSPLEHLPGLLWCAALVAAWRASRAGPGVRRAAGRAVLFATGCATLLVAPALGLVTMSWHALSLVADHFQYLSMIALIALAVGAAVRHWPDGRRGAGVLAATLVVVALVLLTRQRAAAWTDVESLARRLVARHEGSWFGHANLGSALLARGELAEAERHLARAVELNPDNALALGNLAELRVRQDDPASAEDLLRRALAAQPALVEARARLADVLLDQGRFDEAGRVLQDALARRPDDVTVLLVHAKFLLAGGDAPGAAALCRRAVAKRPERPDAHNRLGVALALQGRDAEAEQAFGAALALDPALPEALNNLGMLHARRGERARAAELFRRALDARPGYAQAQANLEALGQG
jgi:Flp pilus assembly protein TadD